MTVERNGTAAEFRLDFGAGAFLLLVLVLQVAIYVTYPVSSAVAPEGADWFGWWDQGRYYESAIALSEGDLTPERHWYSIGYALLGAPFAAILPRHPFLPANILATLVFAWAFLAYFRPLIGYWPSVLAFLAALLLPPVIWMPWQVVLPFWLQFVIPWNTIPVAAAFMTILLLMRGLGDHPGRRRDVVLGLCAGLIAVTRPVDLLPLVPVVGVYVWQRLVVDRRWLNVAAGLLGSIAVVGPVLVLTFSIYGGLLSPYQTMSAEVGMSPASIPYRALATLLDSATFGISHSLFDVAPLLFLAAPLALVWAVLDRRNGLLPVTVALVAIATYLSYNDFSPLNIFRFFLVHYIVWTFPIFVAGGVAGLLLLVRARRWAALAACGVLVPVLLASLTLSERGVPDARIAIRDQGEDQVLYTLALDSPRKVHAVDFARARTPSDSGLPLEEFDVRVDGVPLLLFKGYRAIAIQNGVRFLFTRPVTAERIEIALGGTIANKPAVEGRVRAVAFRPALK